MGNGLCIKWPLICHVLVVMFWHYKEAALKLSFQSTSLGMVCRDRKLSSQKELLLSLNDIAQMKAEWCTWQQLGCRSCWKEMGVSMPSCLRGSSPDFFLGLLTPILPLPLPKVSHKAMGIKQAVLAYMYIVLIAQWYPDPLSSGSICGLIGE